MRNGIEKMTSVISESPRDGVRSDAESLYLCIQKRGHLSLLFILINIPMRREWCSYGRQKQGLRGAE